MSFVAVHVDTKATEFELVMQILLLMSFTKNAITTNHYRVFVAHSFIYLLYFSNIFRKISLFQSSFYSYLNL